MSTILSLDLGYGWTKYCIMDSNGKILKMDKEVSGVCEVPETSDNIVMSVNTYHNFNNKRYLLGDLSTKLELKPIDVMKYEGYKEASPVIISYMMNKFSSNNITKLTIGISPYMWDKRDDYRAYLASSLDMDVDDINIHAQGVSCHYAYARYGLNINESAGLINVEEISQNYIGIDIGFNTLDFYLVVNNSVLDHGIRGMEKRGIVLITDKIKSHVFERLGLDLNQVECKKVLSDYGYRKRGKLVDMTTEISQFIVEYVKDLMDTLEQEYGVQMDKMDNIVFFGGGACIIKDYMNRSEVVKTLIDDLYGDDYMLIPSDKAEYYNSVGYCQLELTSS